MDKDKAPASPKDAALKLAQDAGFWREHTNTWMCSSEDIEVFAEIVRAEAKAEEREECAKVCEELGCMADCAMLAEVIRARGNK